MAAFHSTFRAGVRFVFSGVSPTTLEVSIVASSVLYCRSSTPYTSMPSMFRSMNSMRVFRVEGIRSAANTSFTLSAFRQFATCIQNSSVSYASRVPGSSLFWRNSSLSSSASQADTLEA